MANSIEFIKNSIRYNRALRSHHDQLPEYPCGICDFDVTHNDKSIECSKCSKWIHIRCSDVSAEEYREMQQRNRNNPELVEEEEWICVKCIMTERSEYSPFIFQSNDQLSSINSLDSMNLFDMLPEENVFSAALQTNCLTKNDDDDESNIDNINCKYYSCNEFFNHDNSNSFNILHSNVNGFIGHADNINEFLAHHKKTDFDAICITETSLKDADIPDNAMPNGYEH